MLLLPQRENADHTVRQVRWSLELPAHIAATGNRAIHAGAQLSPFLLELDISL